MRRFEYEVTRHEADTFNELVFYCSEGGQCNVADVPPDQTTILQNILNERGWEGWELVQIAFGKNGLIAFWKKSIAVEK